MTAENEIMRQALAADRFPARPTMDAGALDGWLKRSLAARYGSTLSESLPAELTVLLSELN